MAADLMGYAKMDDQIAIQEAATAGLRSMEHLIFRLSQHDHRKSSPSPLPPQQQQLNEDYREITDFTVSKFKKVISILNRTGHARFRRGPLGSSVCPPDSSGTARREPAMRPPPPPPPPRPPVHALSLGPLPFQSKPPPPQPLLTLDFTKPPTLRPESSTSQHTISTPMSSGTSSFVSSVTGDGSESNGKLCGSFLPPFPAAVSAGKPPMSTSFRKKCPEHAHSEHVGGKYGVAGSRCHCSKRRKARVKKTIRVPAISSKIADIPPDEFSWRKYGQKPIKGSPYPRGYYKCSSLRGCPARKHVERAPDDPTMLIVTYEGEHRHNTGAVPVPPPLLQLESSDGLMFDKSREI